MILKVSFSLEFFVSIVAKGVGVLEMSFFFKSQVFFDFRAQVFELREETQGVATGVHGTKVRTWNMQG